MRYFRITKITRRGVEWHGRAKRGRLFVEPFAQIKAGDITASTWAERAKSWQLQQ